MMTPAHDPKPGEYGPLARKGKQANFLECLHFPVHGEIILNGPKWGQEGLFLLIQTSPTFRATRISILGFFDFVGTQISRIPYPEISRFLNFQISKFLDLGIRFLAIDGCCLGGTNRRLLDSTPGPQNSQDCENPISASPVKRTIQILS